MIEAQPSKNYTTRYLLAAALAEGKSTVRNCATSDDARAMQRCLRAMGAEITILESGGNGAGEMVEVKGFGRTPSLQNPGQSINVGNAGAVLRFLLGTASLLPDVTFYTEHEESLGKRPNGELLKALEQIGCQIEHKDGRLPIRLHGGNLRGGVVEVSGARSSQFLSSLLFLAPLLPEAVEIVVTDSLVSKAPVRQTLEVLASAGIRVDVSSELLHFRVEPQSYRSGQYIVNGDWPGSAAILAAAAVTNSSITIEGLIADEQGETAAWQVLKEMGSEIELINDRASVSVRGAGRLKSVEFDGDLATDAVLALVGAACFAEGQTRFHNIANLRLKECDRITEPLQELRSLGVHCWEGHEVCDSDPNAIIVKGNPNTYDGGIEVSGRGDHRVIMLLTILGLRCNKPILIKGAHHVAKSYPYFFAHMRQLGANIEMTAARE